MGTAAADIALQITPRNHHERRDLCRRRGRCTGDQGAGYHHHGAQMKISHDDAAKRFDDAPAKLKKTSDRSSREERGRFGDR